MKRWVWALPALLLLTLVPLAAPVWALELTVSENGTGSTNEVQVQQTTTTTVTQTNDTSVHNDIEVNASTGGNEASDNNGEVNISTGDVSVEAQATNEVNSNVAQVGCCPKDQGSTAVTISGNGSNSSNTVQVSTNAQTLVTQTNNAVITTTIKGLAVTGRNTATDNGGRVSINTGDVTGNFKVSSFVNSNGAVALGGANPGSVVVKIAGNGTDSVNSINYTNTSPTQVFSTNTAVIDNALFFDAITGENVAANNVGDVHIQTGDIAITTKLETIANNNEALIDNCCEDDVEPPPPPPPPPDNPPPPPPPHNGNGGNGNGGGGNGGGGSAVGGAGVDTGGQVLGTMLPATGTAHYLLVMGLCIALMILGSYLRLLSGRSPSTK